jgi:hypothetical protein
MTDQRKFNKSRTSKKIDLPSKIRNAPGVAKDPPNQGKCERCHRAWKDLLAAGAEYGVFENEGTWFTYHSVGRGVTKQRCIGLKNVEDITFTHVGFEATKHHCYGLMNEASLLNRDRHSRTLYMPIASDFRSYLAAEESKAMRILQEAGLPTDPGKQDTPLSKQENLRRILNSLEKRGLCEFITKEWYAAKIINIVYKLLDTIDYSSNLENMLILAGELGGFIRESEIRFGPIASQSRKGGEQEKQIPTAVKKLVSSILRKNRKATSADLWKMIPTDDCGAVKFDRIKIFTQRDQIRFLVKGDDGNWGYHEHRISFRSFQKYVTAARKALTR